MSSSVDACMNVNCASSSFSVELKDGWPLGSGGGGGGGFATLCQNCWIAYEQSTFCEMFHSDETGWRECTSCGKRLHCGCIASSSMLDLIDTGGVICKSCSNISKTPSIDMYPDSSEGFKMQLTPSEEKQKGCGPSTENGIKLYFEKMLLPSGDDDCQDISSQKLENDFLGSGDIGYKLLSSSYTDFQENTKIIDDDESLLPTVDLSISLSVSSPEVSAVERKLSIAMSSIQQRCRPRIQNTILSVGLKTNSSSVSQLRLGRSPVEGRINNHLLPRYWPRITDQELQQISGESNSTIVPLFEKVLSASDAGRIGRLVLPKACAETYFPSISQAEGIPVRIQDVKGKEWTFQFRFWPNNNSRMYVLEGVTSCIQSMQLQAGDTVIFSRMDPGGKLLMGFRKTSNTCLHKEDSHCSMPSISFQGEPLLGNAENIPTVSGFFHSLKGSRNYEFANASNLIGDNHERRRRNLGPKNKRLRSDSVELKHQWEEEVQDMLRPLPSTSSVEDHEFQEFEEPPVLEKRSIFIVRDSREQWTQCDSCFKWRKMPIDFLIPPKWTCQDNIYDHTRLSCSAPDELSSKELEKMLKINKDFTKVRVQPSLKRLQERKSPEPKTHTNPAPTEIEPSKKDASSVAATTKHPRHRPGCSCIVCIQPPSGKGKHKPTCICIVCTTVKRRFKTLMMRKKKRQAEIAHKNQIGSTSPKKETDSYNNNNARSESEILVRCPIEGQSQENGEIIKGELDLNCCPDRENTRWSYVSMMSLLQKASLPLETYLRQNGLTSLASDQKVAPVANIAIALAQEDHGTSSNAVIQEYELEEGSDEFSENDPS